MASIPFWDPGAKPDSFLPSDGRTNSPALSPWDVVYMAGWKLPGLAKVKGKKGYRIEKKDSPGTAGATLTNLGVNNWEGDIALLLWTEDQLASLQDVLVDIRPAKAAPNAVTVSHPALSMVGVASLHVIDIEGPYAGSIPGTMEVRLKCVEFLPPRPQPIKTTKTSNDAVSRAAGKTAIPPPPKPDPASENSGP